MNSVYITDGLRTFIGAKNKIYKNIPAEALGACVIQRLNQNAINAQLKTEAVIAGNATAGGGNIARLALLKAGLDDSVSGITVDAQCASGMESIISACARIKSGINSTIIAGGAESASTSCIRSWNPNHPNFDLSKESNVYSSAQFIPEDFSENSMIKGADETCRKYGISAEEMIPFVVESHRRAEKARLDGSLCSVILPCFGACKDQLIRSSLTENFIKRLSPVLPEGIINSATSCLFSDGAAFITLSGTFRKFRGMDSGFKLVEACDTGSDRFLSPESLIEVIKKLCQKAKIAEKDVSRIEYNQAFACIDLLYNKNFSQKSNCFGGALAYGHPYSASGAIILLHLLVALEKNKERYGIAAIPGAGGMASAVLVERIQNQDEQ